MLWLIAALHAIFVINDVKKNDVKKNARTAALLAGGMRSGRDQAS